MIGGGFMVGGGAVSPLFSSGMAEFDENFDGIAEFRSTVGDGKLGLFSPEKRNFPSPTGDQDSAIPSKLSSNSAITDVKRVDCAPP